MITRDQLAGVQDNIAALGPKRLSVLAAAGLLILSVIAVGSYYLSRPKMDALYVGLTAEDVSRMGAALQEAGIRFDVNAEGTKVLVSPGDAVRARMLLAEKGLPSSNTAGYELFDKLGSMSLTSFMQNITRLRALEGEIARTIQSMKGVKAARVHIVLPDQGSFRRAAQAPSASVVLRTDQGGALPSARAIRQLVAAAIPGISLDQVSVLSTDGTVLASGQEGEAAMPSKMLELEKTVSKDLQDKIGKTLAPYLGVGNFETSVTARLNLDKKQVSETNFDPESRVERSVRVVRENSNQQNTNNRWAVTVEQNLPADQTQQQPGEQSRRQNERREELTNYELNSKTIATVSEGYRIEAVAVAVVVNRKRLVEAVGNAQADSATALSGQLREVERLVSAAVGLNEARGDRLTVSAVDFLEEGQLLEPLEQADFWGAASSMAHSLVIAVTMLALTGAVIWFIVRPALRSATAEGGSLQPVGMPSVFTESLPPSASAAGPQAVAGQRALTAPQPEDDTPDYAAALRAKQARNSIKRLEEVVELNEEQAAAILKEWIRGRNP
jgi:flagellar M-ring protein FliF